MRTVISFIEEAFDEALGPDLIAALPKIPFPRIGAFIDLYMEHAKRLDSAELQVPSKDLSHCRPVLATEHVFTELNPHQNSFNPQSSAENALSRIQQHLLYCHSLAVIDPFMDLPKRGKFPIDVVRQWFVSYASFLSMAKPLIEEEVLLILPVSFTPTAIFGIEDALKVGGETAADADFADFGPSRQEKINDKNRFFRSFAMSLALLRLTETLQAQLFFNQMVDVYLPYLHYEPALERLIQEAERVWIPQSATKSSYASPDSFTTRRLRHLVALKIPSWDNLDVSDLISIRRGEEFEAWRSSLGRAINELLINGISDEAEARRFLSESLGEARAILGKNVSASRFLNDKRAALKSFAIGGSSAILLSPFLDVSKTLLFSSAQTAISLAVAKLQSGHVNLQDDALRRHYLLFNP